MIPRKRRVRKRRKKNYIPRVVSNDIRRFYATMIMNVFNANDYHVMKSFFGSFAVPSYRVKFRPIDPSHLSQFPEHLTQQHIPKINTSVSFHGDDWLNFHHYVHSKVSPDLVFHLKEARLITRLNDSRSMVVLSTEVEQTQIMEWDSLAMANAVFDFENQPLDSALHEAPEARGTMKRSASAIMQWSNTRNTSHSSILAQVDADEVMGAKFALKAQPQRVCVSSQMILMIDEQKRIESILAGDGRPPPDLLHILERQTTMSTASISAALPEAMKN